MFLTATKIDKKKENVFTFLHWYTAILSSPEALFFVLIGRSNSPVCSLKIESKDILTQLKSILGLELKYFKL